MPALIQRYIMREVVIATLAVATVLLVLFASFSTSRFMAEAANETLGMAVIFQLVGLRTLIALETLLPLAFFLGTIIGLGRLHGDHELVALQAAGIGEWRLVLPLIWLVLPLALVVAWVSLQWRPWAYDLSDRLEAQEEARPLVERLLADRFSGRNEVIHAVAIDTAADRLDEVFIYRRDQERRMVVLARSAIQLSRSPGEQQKLLLQQGSAYYFDATGKGWQVLRFEQLVLPLKDSESTRESRSKAVPTLRLAASKSPQDVAELQWRLSRPSAVLLLALLAIPISRTAPRRGRYGRVLVGIGAYAFFYNLGGVARTWVEQGVAISSLGIWWPQALLAVAILLALSGPYGMRGGR